MDRFSVSKTQASSNKVSKSYLIIINSILQAKLNFSKKDFVWSRKVN